MLVTPLLLDGASGVPPIDADDLHDVDAAIGTGVRLAAALPLPGSGGTATLWSALATIASHDLEAARAIEPHLDAVAILAQADPDRLPRVADRAERTWGVFAAEGPEPLRARPRDDADDGAWTLDGMKPWCSLADRLDAALITAGDPDGERRLFAIDLGQPGVTADESSWHARGLTRIPSGPVALTAVTAYPVGEAGWYLRRPGFNWGGIGVAACWFGGMVGVARAVRDAVRRRPERDITAMHLGAVDRDVWVSSRALSHAAAEVDAGRASGDAGRILARRVRQVVADACEDVLLRAGHALGPAPLATDEAHARRVADLALYIRQHHAEADLAALGRASAGSEPGEW